MAHIRMQAGKYRVEVAMRGVRKSRCFATQEQAQEWMQSTESKILARYEQTLGLRAATVLGLVPKRVSDAIERVEYRADDILDAATPCKHTGGVYFLIDRGRIVYVGRTTHVLRRVVKHQDEGVKRFDAFTFIPAAPENVVEMEQRYILALMPLYNQALM